MNITDHFEGMINNLSDPWRDMDYLVQTNLLSFLVLWKAKRFDQS